MAIPTNVSIDALAFVRRVAESMKSTKDWAYPRGWDGQNRIDNGRAHGALMKLGANAQSLIDFCDSIVVQEKSAKQIPSESPEHQY